MCWRSVKVFTCSKKARGWSTAVLFQGLSLDPTSLTQIPWGTKEIKWPCSATTIRKHFSWSLMSLDRDNKKPQYRDTYWSAGSSHRRSQCSSLTTSISGNLKLLHSLEGLFCCGRWTSNQWDKLHKETWLSLAILQHHQLWANREGRASHTECISLWEGRTIQTTLLIGKHFKNQVLHDLFGEV